MKQASLKAIVNYSDIPIPQFVDIILSGDDEAMYYLLHERMNHLFYLRFQDYSHNLYDEFDDVLDDFFIYVRESGHTPYQALQRIKKKDSFESWLLNTFRNYLNNRSELESHIPLVNDGCEKFPFVSREIIIGWRGKDSYRLTSNSLCVTGVLPTRTVYFSSFAAFYSQ